VGRAPRSREARSRHAAATGIFSFGSITCCAASVITRFSDGTADAPKFGPEAALSTFR
jgi:hypothetical protein